MSRSARLAGSVLALATLGGLGAGAASASVPPGDHYHYTQAYSTKAAAQSAVNAYVTQAKAAKDVVDASFVSLLQDGTWQGTVDYRGPKILPGTDDASPYPGYSSQYVHMVTTMTSQAEATAHMQWTINQLAAHPNDKQVVGSRVTKNSNGRYTYQVNYLTSSGPMFGEDFYLKQGE